MYTILWHLPVRRRLLINSPNPIGKINYKEFNQFALPEFELAQIHKQLIYCREQIIVLLFHWDIEDFALKT